MPRRIFLPESLGLLQRRQTLLSTPVIPADRLPDLTGSHDWPIVSCGTERKFRLGFVYFARCSRHRVETGELAEVIKVGFTAHPHDRIRVLLAESLLLISGCQIFHETHMHHLLASEARGGEFFDGPTVSSIVARGAQLSGVKFSELPEAAGIPAYLQADEAA
jgi:hypothetical protein